MNTKTISCAMGQVDVSIGDEFRWYGLYAGHYKVIRWGGGRIYSPSGIGGTPTVCVKNENGEEIEWCGDSVAHGIFMTKNPDYYKKKS